MIGFRLVSTLDVAVNTLVRRPARKISHGAPLSLLMTNTDAVAGAVIL